MTKGINRREFVGGSLSVLGGLAAGGLGAVEAEPVQQTQPPIRRSILNFNEDMEYRPLGKTGLMVSAVCMGGHWKRVGVILNRPFEGPGYDAQDYQNVNSPDFIKNRDKVVSRCMEVGINYIDACAGPEVLAYSKVLKGRRDKMYLGFSWYEREPRYKEWCNGKKLIEGLDVSLKQAGLDYVDLWRITLPQEGPRDSAEQAQIEEATVEALERAKQQGKARFTGVSTHNRIWLELMLEQYPKQMEVVLFPYTPQSKELPTDSLFSTIVKNQVGVFGIKPFASYALFQGDGSPSCPHREEDDRRARLAIRYVLGNPAITAPIPGLASAQQVENVAKAVAERRQLDHAEKAELDRVSNEMWAKLHPDYHWLRDWEYV